MPHWILHALAPVNALCDDWCLHFWEVVGVWFTGLATFGAVVVSLLLARRDRIRMTISAGHRIMVGPGAEEPYREFLIIRIRNVGGRPATIEGISWRRRPWRRLHALQIFDPTGGYPGPPATIDPGKSHSFSLPLSHTEMQWGEWFLKDFVGRWPALSVHFIRVIAYTPAGDQCSAWLEPSLKEWLVKKAASMKATTPAKMD